MAVPPVSTKPPVKRDEPTPTAATPTPAAVPLAPVPTPATPIPTTPPIQAVYICSADCDTQAAFSGRAYTSSTRSVEDAQMELREMCSKIYNHGPGWLPNVTKISCRVHIIPTAVRICQEPVKSEVPVRGEK